MAYQIYYTPTRREGTILQSPCPSVRLFVRPLVRPSVFSVRPLVRPSVCPSVHTFVTYISASTGRNDCTSTSCLPCDLQMNEWGYSQHDVACIILFITAMLCNVQFIINAIIKNVLLKVLLPRAQMNLDDVDSPIYVLCFYCSRKTFKLFGFPIF